MPDAEEMEALGGRIHLHITSRIAP
jgi:hypothetical protein